MGETQHIYGEFNLWEKLIPKLEGAKHINGGKGSDEVFLESGDGAFCGIDLMVVRGDELDVDCFGLDVLLNGGGTLVFHHIQCRMVASIRSSTISLTTLILCQIVLKYMM